VIVIGSMSPNRLGPERRARYAQIVRLRYVIHLE
jgi:hypothetical protein